MFYRRQDVQWAVTERSPQRSGKLYVSYVTMGKMWKSYIKIAKGKLCLLYVKIVEAVFHTLRSDKLCLKRWNRVQSYFKIGYVLSGLRTLKSGNLYDSYIRILKVVWILKHVPHLNVLL